MTGMFALYHIYPYITITVPGLEEYRSGVSTNLEVFGSEQHADIPDIDTAVPQGFAADIGLAEVQVDPIYSPEENGVTKDTFKGDTHFDPLFSGD